MKELLADKIRKYCNETRIIPARAKGEKFVKIRAGDIRNEMSLQNKMPAICGALQALKFETYANVKRTIMSLRFRHGGEKITNLC